MEKRNPWRLLDRSFQDGAVPVIGDANSLAYVLHLKVGEDWLLEREGREAVKLRVVAALDDSLFQRELLMSEDNFKRLFPEQQGYRFFLFDVPLGRASELSQLLEERLTDEGLDVSLTADRWPVFIEWRILTFPHSSSWAVWDCCWALWAWPWSCFAMCWSGVENSQS